MSGSSDAILAYAAGTRCPASCRSLARVYYSSGLLPPLSSAGSKYAGPLLGNFRIVFVRAAGRTKVHPIPDHVSPFSAFKMDNNSFTSIDLAVNCRICRLRDRHSQTEGSIKVHRRIKYPRLTYVIPPWVLLVAMSESFLENCGGAIIVMEAHPLSRCTWSISPSCRLTDSPHRISLVAASCRLTDTSASTCLYEPYLPSSVSQELLLIRYNRKMTPRWT